jgi:selenide,water dikinase
MDFFPPVVDDPYAFGAIAAANALSDVYAMGGEALFAINLAAFPDNLELSILTDILKGGAAKVQEAGAAIAGGHTITDKEPKYGLAVTGIVHPDQIFRKGGAQAGDALILTKALGTGVLTTALKRGEAKPAHVASAIDSMMTLNGVVSQVAQQFGATVVHAVTDITGFSLVGHAHEMAHLSGMDFDIDYDALPWLDGAHGYAEAGAFPGGTTRNAEYFAQWVEFAAGIREERRLLAYDPQTSGGLLLSISPSVVPAFIHEIERRGGRAWSIGTVRGGSGRIALH